MKIANLFATTALALPALAVPADSTASAKQVNLFVTTYKKTPTDKKESSLYSLKLDGKKLTLNSKHECGQMASWLTYDRVWGKLYCSDEGPLAGGPGTLTSYAVDGKGDLKQIATSKTNIAPVAHVLHNRNKEGKQAQLLMSSYAGFISNYGIGDDGNFKQTLNESVYFEGPGPDADRQAGSHPHAALVDPTGSYLFVPDLGGDRVFVYKFDPKSGQKTWVAQLVVPPGTGPRKGAFLQAGKKIFFFVIGELGNNLVQYELFLPGYETFKDDKDSVGSVRPVAEFTIWGEDKPPKTSFASEIHISPDKKFLSISTRNDTSSGDSDSISTFSIGGDGKLKFLSKDPVGCAWPREFVFNKDGSQVAVPCQQSQKVNVLSRDKATGKIGGVVASYTFPGNATMVVWDD